MIQPKPLSDLSEIGERIFAETIRPQLTDDDQGKFAVIAVTSGEYAIDSNHLAALERMLANYSGDGLYSIRIGSPAAYQLGAHNMMGVA